MKGFRKDRAESYNREIEFLPNPLWNQPIVRQIRLGSPFEEIIRQARDNDIELFEMGSHGRGSCIAGFCTTGQTVPIRR